MSYQQPGYQQPQRTRGVNALAVISLVAGVVWIFGFGSLVAVITGIIALGQIPKTGQGGRGMAIAGTALGAVGILGAILVFVFLGAVGDELEERSDDPAVVRVEAAPSTCYMVTLTSGKSGITQSQTVECGPRQFDLGEGFGRNAVVTKQRGPGSVTAVLSVGNEEKSRQTTNTDLGSVTVAP